MSSAGSAVDECLFTVIEGSPAGNGEAVYVAQDYCLIYDMVDESAEEESEPWPPEPKHLYVIADTFTLTFDARTLALVEIDGLTFTERWARSSRLEPPSAKTTGSLHLRTAPQQSDRMRMHVVPRVEMADGQSWLRIVFVDDEAAEYYDVGPDLRVGLKRGVLCDVYFLSVRLE
jgi:hypothetical protein